MDVAPIAFTAEFTEQRPTRAQWNAFRKRLGVAQVPEQLAEVTRALAAFLVPSARACAVASAFELRWNPGGPWTSRR